MPSQRRTPRGGPGGNGSRGPRQGSSRTRAPAARGRARPERVRRSSRAAEPTARRRGRSRRARAARRPRFTGRAAVLVLVLAVLTVSYASSLRAYLQQRSHIGDLKSQIAEREASIDDLEREKQRWDDPAYVKAQARARFGYLMPGEAGFEVIGADGKPLEAQASLNDPVRRDQDRAEGLVDRGLGVDGARRQPAPARRRAGRPGRRLGHGRAAVTTTAIDPADVAAIRAQLERRPRGIDSIGHRCPCGNPDVVTTEPRLPDGTPFPTTFYLTCPRAASRIGTLEGSHVMKEMQERLGTDEELAAAYRAAHERYLEARAEVGARAGLDVPEIDGISAGGMPDRVKCLHVLAGQSLAMGRGVNPLGDEVLDALGDWWSSGPCVERPARLTRR